MDIFDEKEFLEEYRKYTELSKDGRAFMRSDWKRKFELHRRLLAVSEE